MAKVHKIFENFKHLK